MLCSNFLNSRVCFHWGFSCNKNITEAVRFLSFYLPPLPVFVVTSKSFNEVFRPKILDIEVYPENCYIFLFICRLNFSIPCPSTMLVIPYNLELPPLVYSWNSISVNTLISLVQDLGLLTEHRSVLDNTAITWDYWGQREIL